MQEVDSINQCFGHDRAVVGAVGLKRAWTTKFDMCSPRYTTRLDELPRCRTGAMPFIGMAQTPPTLYARGHVRSLHTSVFMGRIAPARRIDRPAAQSRAALQSCAEHYTLQIVAGADLALTKALYGFTFRHIAVVRAGKSTRP